MYCSSWEDVKLIRLGGTLCSWSRDDLKLGLEWQCPARAGRHVKTYPALDRGVKHRRPRAGLKCALSATPGKGVGSLRLGGDPKTLGVDPKTTCGGPWQGHRRVLRLGGAPRTLGVDPRTTFGDPWQGHRRSAGEGEGLATVFLMFFEIQDEPKIAP